MELVVSASLMPFNNSSKTYKNKRTSLLISDEQD